MPDFSTRACERAKVGLGGWCFSLTQTQTQTKNADVVADAYEIVRNAKSEYCAGLPSLT
jgi:hypothetical protein